MTISEYIDSNFDTLFDERTSCPICRSDTDNQLHQFWTIVGLDSKVGVVTCDNCKFLYKALIPSTELLNRIYNSEYVHFEQDKGVANSAVRSRLRRIQLCHPRKKHLRILDTGCGNGYMVKNYREFGWDGYGIDPYAPIDRMDSKLAQYITKNGIENAAEYFEPESFDVVTAWYVFEHLTDPVTMAQHAFEMLRPGGTLIILVPYADSLAAKFYKGKWCETTLVEHIDFYNKASLTRLARQTGFVGKISFRIAGRPFPVGKVEPTLKNQGIGHLETSAISEQPRLLAKRKKNVLGQLHSGIHRTGLGSSFLRKLIHWTRTGDYIEAYIQK